MKQTKLLYKIIIITSSYITIILGLSYYAFYLVSSKSNQVCGTKEPEIICGTKNTPLDEDASQGKTFFNANCAACHKLDAKITGPALRNTNLFTLKKWLLTNKNKKINKNKFDMLGIDYHRVTWQETITDKDIKNLNAYINSTCCVP